MFTKGKDLEKEFPDIAKLVSDVVSHSDQDVWAYGFVFRIKNSVNGGNFFRYRGELSAKQLKLLLAMHNLKPMPKGVAAKTNGVWTEYSSNSAFDFLYLADTRFFDMSESYMGAVLGSLVDDDDNPLRIYINGRATDSIGNRADLSRHDVVVILEGDEGMEEFGTVRRFTDMPTLEVYQETLAGPYSHPAQEDLWPAEIYKNKAVARAMHLGRFDEVLCPVCGDADCNDHTLEANDEIFVRKDNAKPKFMYAIQSPLLLSEDATEDLKPFAPIVVNHDVVDYQWPKEIQHLEIEGQDATRATCGENIEHEYVVKVTLADPRMIK